MRFIDTHCHINFYAYKSDFTSVIQDALDEGVEMIIVGAQMTTSQRGVELAEMFEKGVYAAVGLHPIHLFELEVTEEGQTFRTRAEEFDYDAYKMLALKKQTVAIGECGLDYYRTHLPLDSSSITQEEMHEKQKFVFIQQIQLANEVEKPIIFHTRSSKQEPKNAYEDLLDIIKKHPIAKKGVVHCFSSDKDIAWQFIELGYLISFTGLITFTDQWDALITELPLEKLMIETDAPFLSPTPHRGKRNHPLYVKEVAKKIAVLKNISLEEVAHQTTKNALQLFQLS